MPSDLTCEGDIFQRTLPFYSLFLRQSKENPDHCLGKRQPLYQNKQNAMFPLCKQNHTAGMKTAGQEKL